MYTWYYVVMTRLETTAALNRILETVGSRGLSGVSSTARTLLQAFEDLEVFDETVSPTERRALVANIRRQKLVELSRKDGKLLIQPSVKGVHRLQRAQLGKLQVRVQSRWDGTWRMVSYDIPARYGKQRRLFTSELHRLGFTLVKDSTWFHPYPCFDVISELIAYCGLTNYVMVAEIARLDENTLRRLIAKYPDLKR